MSLVLVFIIVGGIIAINNKNKTSKNDVKQLVNKDGEILEDTSLYDDEDELGYSESTYEEGTFTEEDEEEEPLSEEAQSILDDALASEGKKK
jgi:hypothetical protein